MLNGRPEKCSGSGLPREKNMLEPPKSYSARFLMAYIMLILILALCAGNYTIFKHYVGLKKEQIYSIPEKSENLKPQADNEIFLQQEINKAYAGLKSKYDALAVENEEILKKYEDVKKQNEELARKNKELIEDNIALQNSLKMAASVGIKPQNYLRYEGLNTRSEFNRGKYIGVFIGTAYTPSEDECGNNKGITNSGKPVIPGVSIAVDNKHWPFGTVFYIKGLGYAVAMDTGSMIKGKYRFDFSVFDKKFAQILGTREWDVYLVKLGKGTVDNIDFLINIEGRS